jgi:hypothetical protein
MSGLITIRIREGGKLIDEETVASEHNEIQSIVKGMKILYKKVELELIFDPPMVFKEAPQHEQQEVENG